MRTDDNRLTSVYIIDIVYRYNTLVTELGHKLFVMDYRSEGTAALILLSNIKSYLDGSVNAEAKAGGFFVIQTGMTGV